MTSAQVGTSLPVAKTHSHLRHTHDLIHEIYSKQTNILKNNPLKAVFLLEFNNDYPFWDIFQVLLDLMSSFQIVKPIPVNPRQKTNRRFSQAALPLPYTLVYQLPTRCRTCIYNLPTSHQVEVNFPYQPFFFLMLWCKTSMHLFLLLKIQLNIN